MFTYQYCDLLTDGKYSHEKLKHITIRNVQVQAVQSFCSLTLENWDLGLVWWDLSLVLMLSDCGHFHWLPLWTLTDLRSRTGQSPSPREYSTPCLWMNEWISEKISMLHISYNVNFWHIVFEKHWFRTIPLKIPCAE